MSAMEEIAISVNNISKSFKLPHEKTSSIKGLFVNLFKGRRTYETQRVLKNVSFEIKKGEFFGIVGRNGSGKSTLLKLLAGIYSPDKGSIQVNGKLTPFIELGVGFNPELTGRENVYLNGALLGFNRKEMEAMYDEIVEFAELERFMDQKLKNYSSGMQVRLAFSIAIRAKSDILVLDEVLAVGDAGFQKKCDDYFKQQKSNKQTIVLVTHDMDSFEKYCDRGVLINDGNLAYSGNPLLLSAEYKMLNTGLTNKNSKEYTLSFDNSIKSVKINKGDEAVVKPEDNLIISVNTIPSNSRNIYAGISVIRDDGVRVAFHSSQKKPGVIKAVKGRKLIFTYSQSVSQFMPGVYSVDVAIYNENGEYIDTMGSAVKFVVLGKEVAKGGVLNLQGEWKVNANS